MSHVGPGKVQWICEIYLSFAVTAMRALAKSSGYVRLVAVIPAIDPASALRKGGKCLQYTKHLLQHSTRPSVRLSGQSSRLQI